MGVKGDNGEILDNNGGGGGDDDDDEARANTAGEKEAWLRVEPIPIIARRTTAKGMGDFFPFPFVIAIAQRGITWKWRQQPWFSFMVTVMVDGE